MLGLLFEVAVIVTFPAFLPVTTPFDDTVAILVSLLDHVTPLSSASVGFTIAVKVIVFPSSTIVVLPSISIL